MGHKLALSPRRQSDCQSYGNCANIVPTSAICRYGYALHEKINKT
jgi:hypothetical protein